MPDEICCEDWERHEAELRECRDADCHEHGWRTGRSEETIRFVDGVQQAIWHDPDLTEYQKGYLQSSINHVKKGAPIPSDNLESYILLSKIFTQPL